MDTTGLRSASHVHFGNLQLSIDSCKSTMGDSYPCHTQIPLCKSRISPDDNLVIEYYPSKVQINFVILHSLSPSSPKLTLLLYSEQTGVSTMKREYTKQAEADKIDMSYIDHVRNIYMQCHVYLLMTTLCFYLMYCLKKYS